MLSMFKRNWEVILVDAETDAETVHVRKRSKEAAEKACHRLNNDLMFDTFLGKTDCETLYFDVRPRT